MTGDEGAAPRAQPGDPRRGSVLPLLPHRQDAVIASEEIPAGPEEVFAVLVDPTSYPSWLVGARHIRGIDRDWPQVGASFRHVVGWGPARIPGSTSVRRCHPPTELVLTAGMGPLGEASVRFEVAESGGGTVIHLEELPARGAARVAGKLFGPAVRLALWGRNTVSLGALSDVVQQRNAR